MKAIKLLTLLALLFVPVASAFADTHGDDCTKKCEHDKDKKGCEDKCKADHKH